MEGEPQQRPPRVSLGHRPTLCAGFLFPLAPNKKDAQRFLRRLIPYGGKESVKENRQDCLSRFIRAQTNPLRRLSAPLAPNKKDAIWRLFYLWEDYKIDFFAFCGLVFVPLRKILSFQG